MTGDFQERGTAVVGVAMVAGALAGVVATGIFIMNLTESRSAYSRLEETRRWSEGGGSVQLGVVILAERLQEHPPVTADELNGMLPGVGIQDEGGKLSLPMNVHLLPAVLDAMGVQDVQGPVAMLAGMWKLKTAITPTWRYPYLAPTLKLTSYARFSAPEEIVDGLELPPEYYRHASRWFTPCDLDGINVNTAPEEMLEGVLAWHRGAAKTWTDKVARGMESTLTASTVNIWPMPGQDSVVLESPEERPTALLAFTLPAIIPTDPTSPPAYNTWWQLIQLAMTKAFFEVKWLYNRSAFPYRLAFFHGGVESFNKEYSLPQKPYAVRMNAWLRGVSVSDAEAIVNGRPYLPGETTQALGAAWVTPEAWCTPVSPGSVGQFRYDLTTTQTPPTTVNVGLAASAFSGWVTLQGAGPYTVASEWYTFEVDLGGGRGAWRTTMRVWPDDHPQVIRSAMEGE